MVENAKCTQKIRLRGLALRVQYDILRCFYALPLIIACFNELVVHAPS